MIEKVKEFFKKDIRKVVLILFILQFILYIFITPNRYDDQFYIKEITGKSIGEFVVERYNNWTSRILIEFSLCVVLKTSKYAWIIGQTLMMTLLGYSIMKIFVNDEKKENFVLAACLFLTYPLDRMQSAGWGATTVNYIWPFAMAMFACIGLKKIWNKEKINKILYVLYTIGLIYGCNQEQVCIFMFLIYLVFTILLIMRDKKKVSKFLIFQDILILISIVLVLVNPGNEIRKASETISAYPDFESYTLLDKLSLGTTSTISELITNSNVVYLVFTSYLAVIVFGLYKDNFVRCVALLPVMSGFVFGAFKDIFVRVFPYLDMFRNIMGQERLMVTAGNYTELTNFVPVILSLAILASIVLCLVLIAKKLKNSLAALVFIAGFATRCAMALSPTIFVSTNRTFVFMEFAMLICTLLIMQEYSKKTEKSDRKAQSKLMWIAKILAAVQYANVLFFIMITQLV